MDLNCLIMDNDSGYVSHNTESNLDSSNENLINSHITSPNKSFCLNEDTLLEKPRLQSIKMCDSFDSLISPSQESIKTDFSGFEESEQSDSSFIIPYSKPIIVKLTPDSQKKEETIPTITKSTAEDLRDCNTSGDNVVVTPQKTYNNPQNSYTSPDLFDDDDGNDNEVVTTNQSPVKRTPTEKYVDRNDLKLLKNVQSNLQGVYPPPSLTIVQLTVDEMLQKIKDNSNLFCVNTNLQQQEQVPSKVCQDWPEILSVRHYGLHHNRSKISEEFELLCGKYGERYVGAETQSTCTVFETIFSPLKRKTIKSKWQTKSPGRRLSHLARRRITFSSANLQQTASSSNNNNSCNNSLSILGSRTRQILVDVRKLGLVRKSPKKSPRKTPTKSPFKTKKATPSNSAKKKLALKFRLMSGELENMASNSNHVTNDEAKRVLFQPARSSLSISLPSMERKSTKRALFQSPSKTSPNKKSPFKSNFFERKRKRSESDENNPPKLMRSMSNISLDLNQSSSSSTASVSSTSSTKPILNRTFSDTTMSRLTTSKLEDLSDVHKKKLQWAVYEALRLQNISPTHPQFKIFASILARVTRRFLQNIAASRVECRTSERMLRIARFHSYAVVKGKSVDEIVNEYLRNKTKQQKPQGYIGIEEFQMKNILQDRSNIIENNKNDKASLPQLLPQNKLRSFNESRIDRIKKVITFEETS